MPHERRSSPSPVKLSCSRLFSDNASASTLLLLDSLRRDRINDQLKPGGDGLLPVAFLVFSVPDRKGNRLHAAGPECGIVVWIPRLHGALADDPPTSLLPDSIPLHGPLPAFAGESAEAPAQQILDRGGPAWDNFEAADLSLITARLAFLLLGLAAVDIGLPVGLPMPDVQIVVQLPHAEEGRGVPKREGNGHPVAEGAWGEAIILRRILPLQEEGQLLTVMEGADRQRFDGRIRQARPRDDLAAEGNDHRGRLVPVRRLRIKGQVAGHVIGTDEKPLRADHLDAEPVEPDHEEQ